MRKCSRIRATRALLDRRGFLTVAGGAILAATSVFAEEKPVVLPEAGGGGHAPAKAPEKALEKPAEKAPEKPVEKPVEKPPANPLDKLARRRLTVIDEQTGFAIGGYDPVAYFIDRKPRMGDPGFQMDWHGAAWLFVNEGNMTAFAERPDVYAPAYGGYCPFAIGQGLASEGNPLIFLIVGSRLFLFSSQAYRVAFLEGGEAAIRRADARWPDVARDLP